MDRWYVKAKHINNKPKFNEKYYKNTRSNRNCRFGCFTVYQYFGHISYGVYVDLEYSREDIYFEYQGDKLIVGDNLIANGIKYKVKSIDYNIDDNHGVYIMEDIINTNIPFKDLLDIEMEKLYEYIPKFRRMIEGELAKRTFSEIIKDWFR
ncbi:hypothetical protein ABD91_00690 [Lysinibacillus sphaericus]|uniref:hypothetical protein n=1 Tax=Lysinibacillus sphaericus TaxID=1421 RepID=UPI0018CE08F5|nr:hypothetical protein [Lysinibacillus sphaericus]MBG9689444.1 hypothetical protein [Lysinibacillus sphaericus]